MARFHDHAIDCALGPMHEIVEMKPPPEHWESENLQEGESTEVVAGKLSHKGIKAIQANTGDSNTNTSDQAQSPGPVGSHVTQV